MNQISNLWTTFTGYNKLVLSSDMQLLKIENNLIPVTFVIVSSILQLKHTSTYHPLYRIQSERADLIKRNTDWMEAIKGMRK